MEAFTSAPGRWWRPLAATAVGIALLVASAASAAGRRDAIDARLARAVEEARTGVGALLTRELTADDVAEPLDAGTFRDLYVLLRAEVLTDPAVARVRIWGRDGTVLFSTGDRAEIGTVPDGDRPIDGTIARGAIARGVTEPFTAATAGLAPVPTAMWETWLPLRTADRTEPQGAVEVDMFRDLVVAGAGADPARWASTLRWLAVAAFLLAGWLAVSIARRRPVPQVETPDQRDEVVVGAASSLDDEEERIARDEVAHERDVSIARALEAEERERLARERLASLAPLEQRLQIAERRALDAERRLDEIDERVHSAAIEGVEGLANGDADHRADTSHTDPASDAAAARHADELRTRLARTAARKKPGGDRLD